MMTDIEQEKWDRQLDRFKDYEDAIRKAEKELTQAVAERFTLNSTVRIIRGKSRVPYEVIILGNRGTEIRVRNERTQKEYWIGQSDILD